MTRKSLTVRSVLNGTQNKSIYCTKKYIFYFVWPFGQRENGFKSVKKNIKVLQSKMSNPLEKIEIEINIQYKAKYIPWP